MKSKVHPTYKTKYRVANWAAYNQALVRRGDGRRCTNRHWPARCQSTGSSPADAIRHRSADGGHPIEDLTAEDDLTSLSVSNSLSGRHWELDQVPAVGDLTDIVQLGTGHHASAGEGQRRVALQRRVAAYLVGGGQTPGATQRCLNPGFSERIVNSRRTGEKEGLLRRRCRHRPVQYLNNIVEQDHRAIKRRVKAKQGFRAFHAARRTIQGYEAMHLIRKGQARWVSGSDVRRQIQFINNLFEVAA